ncbi:MAG TPA: hypothetical protein V6D19_12995 [Stenomitos sp.]
MNRSKLLTAVTQLEDEKLRDPKVVVDEESVKERYIKLKGLLVEDSPVVEEAVQQRVVAPVKRVIRRK